MKKKYITPSMLTVALQTTGMIAASLFGGELGSRVADILDDGTDVSVGDESGSLFDDDAISADDFLNL